jgi:hypothetical protein
MSARTRPQQRALWGGLIIIGILFIAFFGLRTLRAYKKFNGHRPPPPGTVETDVELIRDWMTISFISRAYRVPEKIIFDALNISPIGNHEKSLKGLNNEYFPESDGAVLDVVKAAILAHQPPPRPDAGPSASPPP